MSDKCTCQPKRKPGRQRKKKVVEIPEGDSPFNIPLYVTTDGVLVIPTVEFHFPEWVEVKIVQPMILPPPVVNNTI